VAVWGCGPVGQFSIRCAYMLGASRVIAIDHIPERLEMARRVGKADVLDYADENVLARVRARLTCSGWVGELVARNGSRPGHPSQSMRGGREEYKHR
jgi:threonine dehydrogenase-like Zn-dependent dehydrogenase